MLYTLHGKAHAAGSSSNGTNRCVHIGSSQIRLFSLGNFFELLTGHLAYFFSVRATGTTLHASSLLQEDWSRRSFGNKCKAAITINCDNSRNWQAGFHILSLGIERLTKLHDINTTLTQSRTNGGARVGFASSNLKLDICVYLFSHISTPMGSNAFRLPVADTKSPQRLSARAFRLKAADQSFSTWPNSNSTGVERPKIRTATLTRLLP